MVALPASGKSTLSREAFGTYAVVSCDAGDARTDVPGMVASALAAGQSVVVDNLNLTRETRAPLIAAARSLGAAAVAVAFAPDKEASLRRNRQRDGKARVPDVAIHTAAKRLEPASLAEGFDVVHHVRLSDAGLVTMSVDGALGRVPASAIATPPDAAPAVEVAAPLDEPPRAEVGSADPLDVLLRTLRTIERHQRRIPAEQIAQHRAFASVTIQIARAMESIRLKRPVEETPDEVNDRIRAAAASSVDFILRHMRDAASLLARRRAAFGAWASAELAPRAATEAVRLLDQMLDGAPDEEAVPEGDA